MGSRSDDRAGANAVGLMCQYESVRTEKSTVGPPESALGCRFVVSRSDAVKARLSGWRTADELNEACLTDGKARWETRRLALEIYKVAGMLY
ncbi:hypothetical protein SCP_0102580 [Sparassis crispa]|uniref:Uncharacterized protein n=1 Tax=Sparassis crispa TaxID=139825 RepID=A0A401G5E5_9APHY|nr:hypothetical protein SCP_0102580 [Sparassis crispa]GBE77385.1 hypothetical protein SCP_0102580 [Sparassis crispa]